MKISNNVSLSEYSSGWSKRFIVERNRLHSVIANVKIEHIGSTSIPRMAAKPSIDILIGIISETDRDRTTNLLQNAGYVVEGSRDGHTWLSCPSAEKRDFITHLVVADGAEWNRRLSFRDYLLIHPEVAEAYMELKKDLAAKYPHNLDAYTSGKANFVRDICNRC